MTGPSFRLVERRKLSCPNATKVQLKGQAANPSYQGKLYTVEASFEQGTIPNSVSANVKPAICPHNDARMIS